MTIPEFAPIALSPPPTPRQTLTTRVKALAAAHGLVVSAVSTAEAFPGLADRLEAHIAAGRVDGMPWFTAERAAISADPRNLHTSALSILSVGIAYWSPGPVVPDDGEPRGRIARYAWGADYHTVLKRRMRALVASIGEQVGREVEARCLVDTARIVDRAVAERAGLGWIGKNACLIVPGRGSWVLLGEVLLDVELEPDLPLRPGCGRCSACIDRCPTGAIVAPYTISAPLCLSFQTIEQRGVIPRELRPLLGNWVFGCDECQDVCPYTAVPRRSPDPDDDLLARSLANAHPPLRWLLAMSEEEFRAVYSGTPVTRTKRRGLARNAAVALGNVGSDADVAPLAAALAAHDEPLVRGHAAWALGRLRSRSALGALGVAWRTEADAFVRDEIAAAIEAA